MATDTALWLASISEAYADEARQFMAWYVDAGRMVSNNGWHRWALEMAACRRFKKLTPAAQEYLNRTSVCFTQEALRSNARHEMVINRLMGRLAARSA